MHGTGVGPCSQDPETQQRCQGGAGWPLDGIGNQCGYGEKEAGTLQEGKKNEQTLVMGWLMVG